MNAAEAEALLVESESGRVPDVSRRRRRGVRVTTGAAMALGLALGGGAVAGAASSPAYSSSGPPAHAGMPTGATPAAQGTVKSVGTDTFTLTTRSDTTVTVNVTSATTYRDPGVGSPSFATIAVGQKVAVVGTDTSDVIAATSMMVGNPPAGGNGGKGGRGMGRNPPTAQGTVKSVGTNTFTLTTRSNTTVTVNVTSTTSYRDAGVTSASLANVTIGEMVTVFGTDSSNVVTATSVAIGAAGIGGMGGHPAGLDLDQLELARGEPGPQTMPGPPLLSISVPRPQWGVTPLS